MSASLIFLYFTKIMVKVISKSPIIKTKLSPISYIKNYNKILLKRHTGGLGDILMHRMLFKNIKKQIPKSKLHFACPSYYLKAVEDSEFLDQVIDVNNVNDSEYAVVYTTTHQANKYESCIAPESDKHRSDIWGQSFGLELKYHDMDFNLNQNLINQYKNKYGDFICFCPVSAILTKNLLNHQIDVFLDNFTNLICLHKNKIDYLPNNLKQINNTSISEWMHIIAASKGVISVDSAAFHMAGGLGKPLLGIFTYADGTIYGKYYDHILIQKHRKNGNWDCGPCYSWSNCCKTKQNIKPCLTEISKYELVEGINTFKDKYNLK